MRRKKARLAALCLGLGAAIAISGPWSLALAQHKQEETPSPIRHSHTTEKPHLTKPNRAQAEQQPEIFFCDTHDVTCRSNADSFSIDEIRDLFVFVTLPGVSGQHLETVEFMLPDGELYLRKKAQFQIGDVALASEPKWNDRGKEVAPPREALHLIQNANLQHESGVPSLLTDSRGEATLLTALPIAGTYITQRALTGIWQVRVLLDDELILAMTLNLYSSAGEQNAGESEQGNKVKSEATKGDGRAHPRRY